jgi:hypothetical protein
MGITGSQQVTLTLDRFRARGESEKATKTSFLNQATGSKLDVKQYLADNGVDILKEKQTNDGGTMYCLCSCLFDPNHSPNEAAIVQNSEGKLTYQCFHNSCEGLTWHDARAQISGTNSLAPWMSGGNGRSKTSAQAAAKEKEPESYNLKRAIVEAEDFINLSLPEKKVFIDPWLTELSIILIAGPRGVGKSWFTLSLLVAIAKGEPFGPWRTLNSAPCLYLDGEMAAQDVQGRFVALDQTGEKLNSLFIYSDAYANSQGLPRANLLDTDWRAAMKAQLLGLGVKVWAIDNLASLTPGIDENAKQEWDIINQFLLDLRFAGITSIMDHHTNKAGDKQRGTSAREDNVDISILLKPPENYASEDGASFTVCFTKKRVATENLHKIAETSFQLILDENRKPVWTFNDLRQQRKEQILSMHHQGEKPRAIAEAVGCSIQNVHQVLKRQRK